MELANSLISLWNDAGMPMVYMAALLAATFLLVVATVAAAADRKEVPPMRCDPPRVGGHSTIVNSRH